MKTTLWLRILASPQWLTINAALLPLRQIKICQFKILPLLSAKKLHSAPFWKEVFPKKGKVERCIKLLHKKEVFPKRSSSVNLWVWKKKFNGIHKLNWNPHCHSFHHGKARGQVDWLLLWCKSCRQLWGSTSPVSEEQSSFETCETVAAISRCLYSP